jgi:Mn-dependent DtxR family transcriptional regulator
MRDLVEHDMSALTTALADVLQVSKQTARIRLDSESLIARD